MYFDRFDVAEAYYLYFSLHHEGQGSANYARLSKMTSYFKPRPSLITPSDLSENGQAIYYKLITG